MSHRAARLAHGRRGRQLQVDLRALRQAKVGHAMTLTDFLLARIAEDETAVMPDALARPRLLAECEAKRRIVDLHAEWAADAHGVSQDLAVDTLHALALPYADHPDYCKEWRP